MKPIEKLYLLLKENDVYEEALGLLKEHDLEKKALHDIWAKTADSHEHDHDSDEDHQSDDFEEPNYPNDSFDDAEALASAGFGTDEDYGGDYDYFDESATLKRLNGLEQFYEASRDEFNRDRNVPFAPREKKNYLNLTYSDPGQFDDWRKTAKINGLIVMHDEKMNRADENFNYITYVAKKDTAYGAVVGQFVVAIPK